MSRCFSVRSSMNTYQIGRSNKWKQRARNRTKHENIYVKSPHLRITVRSLYVYEATEVMYLFSSNKLAHCQVKVEQRRREKERNKEQAHSLIHTRMRKCETTKGRGNAYSEITWTSAIRINKNLHLYRYNVVISSNLIHLHVVEHMYTQVIMDLY